MPETVKRISAGNKRRVQVREERTDAFRVRPEADVGRYAAAWGSEAVLG